MGRKKYLIRNCIECNKEIRIRSDYIKEHLGRCQSCTNRFTNNNYPGRKEQLIKSMLGRKASEETKLKKSLALKGRKRPQEVIDRIRKSNLGKKRTPEQLLNQSKSMKGKRYHLGFKASEESKKRMSDAHKTSEYVKKYGGKNNWNYKGGSGDVLFDIRCSPKSIQWRRDVFNRDKYSCIFCRYTGKELNAHHIHRFLAIIKENNIKTIEDADSCEELWNIENGITLCKFCHMAVHKGERKRKKHGVI